MRKIGIVLLGVGAFLVVLAALVKFYMAPSMTKTPLDVDSTTYLAGDAELFDADTGGTKPVEVGAVSYTQVDGEKSDDEVASWVNTTCVVNLGEHDVTECLSDDNPATISLSTEYFATDRVSAEAVDNPTKYVPSGSGTPEGLMNKFPFDSEKKAYPYWDATLGGVVEVEFDGTDTIDGLEVYKYQQLTVDEPIQVREGIPGTYSMDKTIYVEPVTGSIIHQVQHDVRKFEDGDTALDMQLAFTDEQQKENVESSEDSVSQLKLINATAPLVALILGLLALIVGAVLSLRRGRGEHDSTYDEL